MQQSSHTPMDVMGNTQDMQLCFQWPILSLCPNVNTYLLTGCISFPKYYEDISFLSVYLRFSFPYASMFWL